MAVHPVPFSPVPVTLPRFSRILVPIDFSDASILALDRAIDLARIYHASLVLAHVINYQATGILTALVREPIPSEELDPQDDLDNLRKMILSRGVPCSMLIRKGPILQSIRDILSQEAIDLLVLATHGSRGVSGSVIGSTAEDLIRSTTIPVVSISPVCQPPWWDEKGARHILFAGSFAPETLCGLSLALGMQQVAGAKLSVVEVLPPGAKPATIRAARERIESLVPPGTEIYTPEGPIGSTVRTLALRLGAGLIALGVHRTSLARELFGTALFEILLTAPCPVLTVRQCDE